VIEYSTMNIAMHYSYSHQQLSTYLPPPHNSITLLSDTASPRSCYFNAVGPSRICTSPSKTSEKRMLPIDN